VTTGMGTTTPPTGVLLMAYGSPSGPDDLEAYYTDIRGGRKPSPELLEELAGRYRAIGGRSPLLEITQRQAEALQARLTARVPESYRIYIGMKHAQPFIAQAVTQMGKEGVAQAVGIALAPHFSKMSIGAYIQAAEAARTGPAAGLIIRYVERWGDHPLFVDALADRLGVALAQVPETERQSVPVVFTAHSLPERILTWADPYPDELQSTSKLVSVRCGVRRWTFAYQSAGRTSDPWLGPDVLSVLRRLREEGERTVVACSVGFITDHLEVLYDLDIEARRLADQLGMRLIRAASLNDHPLLIEALADLVQGAAVSPQGVPAAS
jgi:protoporphyrin/coproporphyrin ferrochelatase